MTYLYDPHGRPLPELDPENKGPEPCKHPKLIRPDFDKDAAANLEAGEVQRRWPRKTEWCPDCQHSVIMYASFEHYISGDW